MLADREAALVRDLVLPLLDLRVVELLDAATLHADEMVVMLSFVQLEHRLAGLEMMTNEETRLLARSVGHSMPTEIAQRVETIRLERALLLGGLRR